MTLALIAGRGRLPELVAEAEHARVCVPAWAGSSLAGGEPFHIERFGSLLSRLRGDGVERVCLAGAVDRPPFDPARIDAETEPMIPRMMAAAGRGDDGALRVIVELIEEAGMRVVAPHEVRPDLLPPEGPLVGAPTETDRADADRAAEILAATGRLDIGQGCVVAQGLCLAVEALPGTDFMLRTLAGDLGGKRPDPSRGGGVLLKAPKPGQDMRVDMPAIGPDTVRAAASAGLAGIVVAAGAVLVLDREKVEAEAARAGLFVWARA